MLMNDTARSAAATALALQRCKAQDHRLHAFITLSDTAMEEAARLDAEGTQGLPLAGMTLGIKDLTDTAGLRTTYGSTVFRDHVPQHDDLLVARARAAGAVIIGKTNTPEFGFGALCANALCPSTANPHDLALSSGGSSGGSAAAVAAGLVTAALGTDFGGSVRTPAAFCGVVGFRPSAGLLPAPGRPLAWNSLPTAGLITRSATDAQRLLDALAGPDPRDPLSWCGPVQDDRPLKRIAISRDLGVAPVAQDIAMRFEAACADLQKIAGRATTDHPDCAGAMDAFATLRAALIHHNLAPLLRQHGDLLAPTVRWNIARGEGLSAFDFLQAEAARSALYRRFSSFFEHHDVLVTPATAVMPFGVDAGEVTQIDGRPLDSLIDYLAITAIITLTGCPALSLCWWPDGEALPIGIQLVAAPGRDRALLAFAAALEGRGGFGFRPPPLFRENFP